MRTGLWLVVLCAGGLMQTGCKGDPVAGLVTTLSSISTSSAITIAVVSSLEADGAIGEETARQIIRYSQAVSQACADSVAELNSGDPTSHKVLHVIAVFSAIPQVTLTDKDPKAAAAIQAVQVGVQALLRQLSAAKTGDVPAEVSLTKVQAAELARIEVEALATVAAR